VYSVAFCVPSTSVHPVESEDLMLPRRGIFVQSIQSRLGLQCLLDCSERRVATEMNTPIFTI
jgi:hypothetical protein